MKKLNRIRRLIKDSTKNTYLFILLFISCCSIMESQTLKDYEDYLTVNNNVPISYFDIAISEDFTNAGYLKLMKIYHLIKANEINQAEKEFSKINVEDKFLDLHQDLFYMVKGLLLFSGDNRKESLENFKLALSKEKEKNKWLRLELFFFYLGIEDYKAFGYLDEALEIDPNFNEAIIEKSFFLDAEYNYDLMIEGLEKIPSSYRNTRALDLLGAAYFNNHRVDDAINILNLSIEIEPTTDNYYFIGYIFDNGLSNYSLAEEYYTKSLNYDNKNEDSINAYAWLLFKTGRINLAEDRFLSLLKINKDQTIYDQIIQFYLYNKQDGMINKAKNFIEESKLINGESFTNAGYDIIFSILIKEDFKNSLLDFKNKHGEFEIEWLKNTISEFESN